MVLYFWTVKLHEFFAAVKQIHVSVSVINPPLEFLGPAFWNWFLAICWSGQFHVGQDVQLTKRNSCGFLWNCLASTSRKELKRAFFRDVGQLWDSMGQKSSYFWIVTDRWTGEATDEWWHMVTGFSSLSWRCSKSSLRFGQKRFLCEMIVTFAKQIF